MVGVEQVVVEFPVALLLLAVDFVVDCEDPEDDGHDGQQGYHLHDLEDAHIDVGVVEEEPVVEGDPDGQGHQGRGEVDHRPQEGVEHVLLPGVKLAAEPPVGRQDVVEAPDHEPLHHYCYHKLDVVDRPRREEGQPPERQQPRQDQEDVGVGEGLLVRDGVVVHLPHQEVAHEYGDNEG